MTERTALAEAFSRHRFDEVAGILADDVRWDLVGGSVLEGREAVLEMCSETRQELVGVTTTWESVRVLDAGATVVVDTIASYLDAEGEGSRVRSCDLYDFRDDRLASITSFAVELEPATPGAE